MDVAIDAKSVGHSQSPKMRGLIADYRVKSTLGSNIETHRRLFAAAVGRLSDKTRPLTNTSRFVLLGSSASLHGLNRFRRSAGAHRMLLGLNDKGLRDGRSACSECEKQRGDFKGSSNPTKVRDRSVSQHD